MKEKFRLINSQKGLSDLKVALDRIAVIWDLSKKQLLEINLILEELLANLIEHVDGSNCLLEVEITSDGSIITIVASDEGPPFNPLEKPAVDVGLPMESRKEGGLGLHFVNHFADTFSYSRGNGRNIVKITRKVE